jgi:hypothetical protein
MTASELIGATRPTEPGGPGRHRWNIMQAAMLPSHVSRPRSMAAWAFRRPVTIWTAAGRAIVATASAGPWLLFPAHRDVAVVDRDEPPVDAGVIAWHVEPDRRGLFLECREMPRPGEIVEELADGVRLVTGRPGRRARHVSFVLSLAVREP